MAEPFLGELRLMSFDYPLKNWAECNGQTLPIKQNQSLFYLLGTKYGGDGKTNFGLPNMGGRVPIHVGTRFSKQGEAPGEEYHRLTEEEMPKHAHTIMAATRPGAQAPPALLAQTSNLYRSASDLTPIHPETILPVGADEPHENRSPLLVLNWCIALLGIEPTPA